MKLSGMGEDQVLVRNLEPVDHPILDVKCAVAYVRLDLAGKIRLQDTNLEVFLEVICKVVIVSKIS